MNTVKHIPLVIDGKDYIIDLIDRDGDDMVAIRSICEAVGLDRKTQQRKIQSNPRFKWGHMTSVASDGKNRGMLCIPVRQVGMWLCGINSRKAKKEVRGILLRFQEHCQAELHAAITGRAGMALVEELQKTVKLLAEQVLVLSERLEALEGKSNVYDSAEQALASVGGHLMSRARKTKPLRTLN